MVKALLKELLQSDKPSSEYVEVLESLVSSIKEGGGSAANEIMQLSSALGRHMAQVDPSFISCIIFPEMSSVVRLPLKFPVASAVFSQSTVFHIDPNIDGEFGLKIYPKGVGDSGTTKLPFGSGGLEVEMGFIYLFNQEYTQLSWGQPTRVSNGVDNISEYFESVRLVGFSISCKYFGGFNEMAGFMSACIDYSNRDGSESTEMVDDGTYMQSAQVNKGIRVVWMPRDEGDLETFIDLSKDEYIYGDRSTSILIYGTGLPTSTGNKIRCEVTRHFEGLPKHGFKDYTDVKRASPNAQAVNTVIQIHDKMPFLMFISPSDVSYAYRFLTNRLGQLPSILGGLVRSSNQIVDARGNVIATFNNNGSMIDPEGASNFYKYVMEF